MNYTLGEIIKTKRIELGLTQIGLSKLSEVDCKTISFIERNIRKKPVPETLLRLADALNLDPVELFFASGYKAEELDEKFKRIINEEHQEKDYSFDFTIMIKGSAFISASNKDEAMDNAAEDISSEIVKAANSNELLNTILHDSKMNIFIDIKEE